MLGERKPKVCKRPGCNNSFMPYMSTDKYCSPKCAMSAGVGKAVKRTEIKRTYSKPKMHKEPSKRVRMKKEAKVRDGYQCRLYGVDGHTCGLRRESHHILYVSEFNGLEGDELWNLICLCDVAHHGIVHKNKGYWQHRLLAKINGKDFFDVIPKEKLSPGLVQKLRYLATLPLTD